MTYLSHLYLPGALALWSALFFALAAVWGYSLVLRGDGSSLVFARRAALLEPRRLVVPANMKHWSQPTPRPTACRRPWFIA